VPARRCFAGIQEDEGAPLQKAAHLLREETLALVEEEAAQVAFLLIEVGVTGEVDDVDGAEAEETIELIARRRRPAQYLNLDLIVPFVAQRRVDLLDFVPGGGQRVLGVGVDEKEFDPLTAAARVTERFRRVTFGRLDIEVTVDDPKAYSRPWTVTLNQDLAVDTELLDYHCTDNEKSRLVAH
jgi:hypothetical protein